MADITDRVELNVESAISDFFVSRTVIKTLVQSASPEQKQALQEALLAIQDTPDHPKAQSIAKMYLDLL